MDFAHICIVSKPYDVDQAYSYIEKNKIDKRTILWVTLFYNFTQLNRIKKYLNYNGINKSKTLIIPSLLDYVIQIWPIRIFFTAKEIYLQRNKIEKDQIKVENKNNKLYEKLFKFITTISKIFLYVFAKFFWLTIYYYYKFKFGTNIKYNLLITQAFHSKLTLVSIIKFKKIILYNGGRHSITTNEEFEIKKNGLNSYIKKIFTEKRAFGIPKFVLNKILNNVSEYEYNSHTYLNRLDGSNIFSSRKKLFAQKKIKKNYVLIAGSFDIIDENYILGIKKILFSSNNDLELINDIYFVYRPHPRQLIKKKELEILNLNNFYISYPDISIDVDLLESEFLPSIIYLGNSSSVLTLKSVLPNNIQII